MKERGRSSRCSRWVAAVFLGVPAGLGRRVCGVAVKAERPEAEPRTNGLEGDAVRAMLVEPGRRNVQDKNSGRVFTRVEPVAGAGRGSAAGHPSAPRAPGLSLGGMV